MNYKDYSNEERLQKDKEFADLSETQFQRIREKLSPEEITYANELI